MNKVKGFGVLITLIGVMMAGTGCPLPVDEQPIATAMSFKTTADGEVLVQGNLFGPEGVPEGQGLSAKMQQNIRSINFGFYHEDEYGSLQWLGYANVTVASDGTTDGTVGFLNPDVNYAHVSCLDERGRILFLSQTRFSLKPGETTEVEIGFEFPERYQYSFVIPDLPGEYGEYGEAKVLSAYGETNVYWSRNGGGRGKDDIPNGNEMIFEAFLDLHFDDGILTIIDQNGEPYAANMDFDIFSALDAPNGIMYLGYAPADDLARFDFTSVFPSDNGPVVTELP